jgi:hypothetical protein
MEERVHRILAIAAAGALLASAPACGGSSDPGTGTPAGGCDVPSAHACIEWSNTAAGNAQTACSYTQGTWSTTLCSPSSRVGRCAVDYGSYVMTVSYYPGAGTEADLRQACEQSSGQGGVTTTWTAG